MWLFLVLLLFPAILSAETVTIRWAPVTERENGSPVDSVQYEVWYNNELDSTQAETEYTKDLDQGAHTIQVFAVEDGMRSMPTTFTFDIRRFPPKQPRPL